MDIYKAVLSKHAKKDVERVPSYVVLKLQAWIEDVTHKGLRETSKIPGYHDEPLRGNRKGQRSIRLTKHYRAIYIICNDEIEFIEVIEVNKHDY